MRLVFIYGPPASGKFTIAKRLSESTGIPLFHNHLSRDIVEDIYKDSLMEHHDLVDRIRFDVLDYCAKNDTDLIFTYVYEGWNDDENARELIRAVENNKGEVLFVELSASPDDLIARVNNESRKRYNKLRDPEVMKNITRDMSIYSIPFVKALKIDTSATSPEDAVIAITETYQLI